MLVALFLLTMGTLTRLSTAIPAFPGAEGFGAVASGGRHGSVYVVTNLNDTGAGSFRDAVSSPNRIVVFAVGELHHTVHYIRVHSGLITIGDRIVVSPNVTIAGQTAPGQGITVYGNGLSYSGADNTITRYIRYRMGTTGDAGKDAITIANGQNMIFDHVSVSWGRDETFSINGDVSNITISDCIIAQGLETHSAGGLIQTSGGVSILRTLYIDNQTRNPKTKGVQEYINNVVYNWGTGGGYICGDSDGLSEVNIINNVFISGPSTGIEPFTRGNLNFQTNYYDPDQDGTRNGFILSENIADYSNVSFQANPYPYPGVAILFSPTDALSHVISSAGASLSRDHLDNYLINTELGSFGKVGELITDPTASPINGPGPVTGGTAPKDTDGDGIPDAYESAHGLNPSVNDAMVIASNGYANIENYVNSLV
ncbi:pectin lyase-like protein [Punctularia strigosozonata HHB-11173 SS5]|uniref:pectin lyase-like protein n=1 Tax=Punctularia strigosozonata (strain HHB-11173) TaxID=741275 RepID=UPI0004417490|nr:pectin lyase-like protein [Punctularia strigosozonata HHB-11173 SS5]EIN07264.1 pectin lyase-like protein [Punctularia strigosozonata HHB-11173 SS5]